MIAPKRPRANIITSARIHVEGPEGPEIINYEDGESDEEDIAPSNKPDGGKRRKKSLSKFIPGSKDDRAKDEQKKDEKEETVKGQDDAGKGKDDQAAHETEAEVEGEEKPSIASVGLSKVGGIVERFKSGGSGGSGSE